ncbi:M48 family metallopeptidase [Chryseobacterium oryctis]|uniref:M48 family metallopeptidase n=1 Tax=Chryseobacterium oryctis TaxID=2952618 RepID=A0ABT3HLC8_9FLAO|nr:M48 family metallopeptidase [Chryseobacterium oryctis]MCW3160510.1 M48 family metallopeptidase [Chryseobacterium oryctis]
MNTRFISLLFLMFFSWICFGQIGKTIDTADYLQRKEFLKNFSINNELFIKKMKSQYSGKTGFELSKVYKEFGDDFEKQVKNKDFIFKSDYDASIKSLILRLRKNNPQLPQDLKILIARDNTPNAYCLLDGTFVINMGLFSWLNNEEEIAAVIAHELGHRMSEHSLNLLVNIVENNQLDKSTVKSLRGNENSNQKAFDILKNRMYKKGIEKRKQEIEADSLGYVIFRNADFKKTEFVNALKKLKDFDTISPRELKVETYKKFFELPKQPFNDKWLKKEDFSLYNYNFYKEKLDKDSLSSHPEMTKRIEKLKKFFPELIQDAEILKPTEDYLSLKKAARAEILPNLYHSEDYGVGIYASLQFLQDGEDEKFYKNWLGKFFAKIYEARKNYNLNRYLDRIEPKDQSESYQQFLNFMWNLRLEEIKNITDFYQNKES